MEEINVLVVDDESAIADLVEFYLKNENYRVCKCYNGTDALDCLSRMEFQLAVLDVMLPDVDGFTICQKIREEHFFPIIMLTAKVEDMDKIMGLTIGADDYITKPFNPLELVARVKTQLRRYRRYNQEEERRNGSGETGEEEVSLADGGGVPAGKEYDFLGLIINQDSHRVTLFGKPLQLTPTEFSILWYLCENRGRVVSAEELFEAVWGDKFLDNNNTVMAHVARLREKMKEPPRKPKFIKTVWGVGYTIEA